jgi:hypothetical protein
MMNRIFYPLISLAIILLIPSVIATSDCPCSLPGNPGYTVGFDCYNRSVENVTLYHLGAIGLGDELIITAGKEYEGDILLARNLTIEILLDDAIVFSDLTDDDGITVFVPSEPGTYTLHGGDFESTVDVIGEKAKAPLTLRQLIFIIFGIQDAPYA